MLTRRRLLEAATSTAALAGTGLFAPRIAASQTPGALKLSPMLSAGTRAEAVLDALPGKQRLIKLSYRPPNYETPIEHFRAAITPNDAFFVRYHLSDIPEVDAKNWKLAVGQIRQMVEITVPGGKTLPTGAAASLPINKIDFDSPFLSVTYAY